MKVKIGDKIYSNDDQPIMIILSEDDKKNINSLPEGYRKYATFPDCFGTVDEMHEWMNQDGCEEIIDFGKRVGAREN